MSKISLGDRVKDKVSGFQGVAVARHTYLAGCDRISIQPPVDKDGKLPDSMTFDEPHLELVEPAVVHDGPRGVGGPEKYMPSRRPGE